MIRIVPSGVTVELVAPGMVIAAFAVAMAAPMAAQRERVIDCVPGAVRTRRLNRTQLVFGYWRWPCDCAHVMVGRGRVRPVVIDRRRSRCE